MKKLKKSKEYILQKKFKKFIGRSRFVGGLYFIGTLAIMVLAFFPMFTYNGQSMDIKTAFSAVLDFSKTTDYGLLIKGILYLWLILATLVGTLSSLTKLKLLSKHSQKYVDGCEKIIKGVKKTSKHFSHAFARLVIVSLLMFVFTNPVTNGANMSWTMYSYIALGVSAFIRLVCGTTFGKLTTFYRKNGGVIEQDEREIGIAVFFWRNLFQIVGFIAIIFFFAPMCVVGDKVIAILGGASPLSGDMITEFIPFVLQAVILLSLLVLIKHATNSTEYNREGIDGKGMKNCRVFAFIIFLMAVACFVITNFIAQATEMDYRYLYIAGSAFVVFFFDCILKNKEVVEDEEEEVEELSCGIQPTPDMSKPQQPMPYPYPQMPNAYPYPQMPTYMYPPVIMQTGCQMQGGCPCPLKQPQETSVAKEVEESMSAPQEKLPIIYKERNACCPMPAPKHIQPTPAPSHIVPMAYQEQFAQMSPKKSFKVRCPKCGKQLMVKETSPYHRCPACSKVFTIQKFQAYVEK